MTSVRGSISYRIHFMSCKSVFVLLKCFSYLFSYPFLNYFLFISVPMMRVETVSGMLTNLPCNITPSVPGDRVLIVLWYKDGYGKPIYSFDLRDDSPESEGLFWANEDGGDIPRAQLNVKSQPTAFLSLLGVEEKDGGIYRCRVDFKKSPTRFWKVDLTVIGLSDYSSLFSC